MTYHDSCCLGRQNEFYEAPRQLLQAIPGVKLVEMVHNRVNSICCGGGGGGMWLDTYFKAKGYETALGKAGKRGRGHRRGRAGGFLSLRGFPV